MQLQHLDPQRADGSAQHPILNEAQRRHFAVFLELLQKSLGEVERLTRLHSDPPQASLTLYDQDLPEEFVRLAPSILRGLRERVEAIAGTLGIGPSHRSRLNTIRAILTAEVVRVDDSFSGKLSGYGSVNPMVEVEIDPQLAALRSDLKTLLASLHQAKTK
jgi:hypothetical protein